MKNPQKLKVHLYIEIFFLSIIFFITCFLRLKYALNSGAWLDEASVYTLATGYDFQHLLLIQHWDVAHPPLLYILVRLIVLLNNFNFIPIIYLRLPFVFFSSLAIVPLYIFSKKIIKNKFALFIPFWYAIHPFQILMGYSMRPYGLLQFLFPIALFAFFDESWNKKWKIIFWNIFFIFLFFWDYASIWFFGPYFFYIIFIRKKFSFMSIILMIKQSWIFWIPAIWWLSIFLPRINEVFILTNYTKVSLIESFLIFNVSTWLDFTNKNYVFLWLSIFILFLLINIYKTPVFLIVSLLPLITVALISRFISPILISENLIYVSIILLIIYGMIFKNTKILFKLFFGIIFSLILLFNLSQASKYNHLSYPTIELHKENFDFLKTGNYIFLSYNEYLQYSITYNLLRNGYFAVTNTNDSFFNKTDQIKINAFNIKDSYQQIYLNTTPLKDSYKYFISYNQKSFSDHDIQNIRKYCQFADNKYENLKNNLITFIICQ